MVREATGRPIAVDAHPKHSMALGAAMVAEMRRKLATDDTTVVPVAGAAAATTVLAGTALAGTIPTMRPGQPGRLPRRSRPGRRGGGRDRHDRRRHGRVGRCRQQHPQHRLVAVVGVIALVAILAIGASGMLGGVGPLRRHRPRLGRRRGPIGRLRVAIAGADAVTHHRADPDTRPHPDPHPHSHPTPAGRQARIGTITVSDGRYVVDYQVFGYDPQLPGRHVHFFFDTVKPTDAGVPGKAVGAVRGSHPVHGLQGQRPADRRRPDVHPRREHGPLGHPGHR